MVQHILCTQIYLGIIHLWEGLAKTHLRTTNLNRPVAQFRMRQLPMLVESSVPGQCKRTWNRNSREPLSWERCLFPSIGTERGWPNIKYGSFFLHTHFGLSHGIWQTLSPQFGNHYPYTICFISIKVAEFNLLASTALGSRFFFFLSTLQVAFTNIVGKCSPSSTFS